MSFSDVERSIIFFLSKKFQQGFQAGFLRVPSNNLRKTIFFEKKILSKFSDFVRKVNWFWQKLFSKIVKTAFWEARAKFWFVFSLEKKSNFVQQSLRLNEKLLNFPNKISANFSELHLRVQRYYNLTKVSSWWKIFFVKLFLLRAKKKRFGSKSLRSPRKRNLRFPREHFIELFLPKLFLLPSFSYFEWVFFTCGPNFLARFSKLPPTCQSNILR